MDFENLKLNAEDGILTITINREEKLNALNSHTIRELGEAFQSVYDDNDIKAVIITGYGEKAFAAGADIKEVASLHEVNARKFAETGQEVFAMIENCNKPVIAAINGFALGAGCELAMACHMRIASENAKLGLPEVNLGLIPGYGGTQRLTQLIGKGKAMELMITADMISATDALRLGLVNHIATSKAEAISKAEEILKKIMSKAPLAVGMIVNCVNAAFDPEERGYQTEANSFSNLCKSKDFQEGTSAFIEKRKSEFIGE